ncbi:MAG TPA: hypothetical protein VFV79_00925 [Saprospiraceae bacterium]|nr:hypothetical protein [Saprospiraceae bacterium]
MMSRYLFILVFFVFGMTSLAAQVAVDPAIQVRFDSFIHYSNLGQWDKAFNLVYPKLFSQVPKAEIVQMMHEMGQGLDIKMENTKITDASAPVKEGTETFVRISYTSTLVMKIDKGGNYDAPKPIQAIGEQLKSTYGGRSVQWDADQKQYNILATKNMMAVKSDGGEWYLVEINMEQPTLMESLFPENIMEQLVRTE